MEGVGKPMKKKISISIDENELKAIDASADAYNLSRSGYIESGMRELNRMRGIDCPESTAW